jgi:hypothetical protein
MMSGAASMPTVFVGILHTDEAQFESSLAAVREQQGCRVAYQVIGGLAEQEASRRLYSGLNDGVGRFDVRARVDADMVIVSQHLFAAAGALFAEEDRLGTITVALDDFFTGREIKGLHLWRREVRWLSMPGALFGDAVINTSRYTLTVTDLPRPIALHAPDPSLSQSARFGSHRTLKALVQGSGSKQWTHLRAMVAEQARVPHPARSIAIAAVVDAVDAGGLERHLRATLGRGALDVDRLGVLADDPELTGRALGLLEDDAWRVQVCDRLGPVVRASIGSGDQLRGRLIVQALTSRVQRSLAYRVRGAPDEHRLRSRFLEHLGFSEFRVRPARGHDGVYP